MSRNNTITAIAALNTLAHVSKMAFNHRGPLHKCRACFQVALNRLSLECRICNTPYDILQNSPMNNVTPEEPVPALMAIETKETPIEGQYKRKRESEQEKASAIKAVVNRMEQEKASAIETVVNRMEQEKAAAIEAVVREKSSAVENDKEIEAALQSKNAVIASMQKTFSETITSATQGLTASVRELEKQLDQNNRAANVAHDQQMALLSEKDKIIDKLKTTCASKDNEIRELQVANASSSSSSSPIANPSLATPNAPSAPVVNRVTAPAVKKKRSAPASSKKPQAKKIKDVKTTNKNKKEGFKNWLKANVQKIKKSDEEVKRYTCKSLHTHCKDWCRDRGLSAPSDRGEVRFKDLMIKAGYAHGCTNSGSNFYKSIKSVKTTVGLIECNMARKVTQNTPKV